MVLWDWAPTLGLSEDEPTKEIQVSSVNVTTRSKGSVVDESLLLPKIKNLKENAKKIISTNVIDQYDTSLPMTTFPCFRRMSTLP